jgi:hypothetical protein
MGHRLSLFRLTAADKPPGAVLRGGQGNQPYQVDRSGHRDDIFLPLTGIILMSYTRHMDIERHVQAIQADLAAAAALGDEAVAVAGQRLAAAVGSSLQLRLLDVLTEATLSLNAQLSAGHVEVRLAGRDPDLVLVEDGTGEGEAFAPAPGDDLSARITLRLPEALKAQVETASASEGVSTNAWIVRALFRSLEPRAGRARTSGKRLQGFTQS